MSVHLHVFLWSTGMQTISQNPTKLGGGEEGQVKLHPWSKIVCIKFSIDVVNK